MHGWPVGTHHKRPQDLRTTWCWNSHERGWESAEEWWTPAVESLCRALVDARGDVAQVCAQFGGERAQAGVGVGATMEDFAALCEVTGGENPPFPLVKALVEGWVDGTRSRDDCRDPLTGLAVPGYLRTRLGELYEASAGDPPQESHRLLVAVVDSAADPWSRIARLIVVSHELRSFFGGGVTVALLSKSRVGILAAHDEGDPDRVAGLDRDLRRRHGAELWNVPLPGTYPEAAQLLRDIARPS
ncbi:hypothetical protein J4H86_16900 [Spiractinospora alimapuensis]|uniref:hypothetical protein n=1 Tax=Spiractinospora alimapuensis TaxID=2820884 RepID=UPI001F20AEF1|nr:hypothetical protein [Spiractinospora alimapuensis]QVQ50571.1 hypothetical protein J4H86_16900 [Spiractinospora alimapuensis]